MCSIISALTFFWRTETNQLNSKPKVNVRFHPSSRPSIEVRCSICLLEAGVQSKSIFGNASSLFHWLTVNRNSNETYIHEVCTSPQNILPPSQTGILRTIHDVHDTLVKWMLFSMDQFDVRKIRIEDTFIL